MFDADSPESVTALNNIEKTHGIQSKLINYTSKGEHHCYKRAIGTVAKTDSHCTKEFPDRIDVKTGRSMVILPPSTGKTIGFISASNANDLSEVGQDFIDAISRHNGRDTPHAATIPLTPIHKSAFSEVGCSGLKAVLVHLDPDLGYEDWLKVNMAIYHYTRGSDVGFDIANAWSSTGSKYKGEYEIREKWNSFNLDHPRPITIATIMYMVENGAEIYQAAENPFEVETFEVVTAVAAGVAK